MEERIFRGNVSEDAVDKCCAFMLFQYGAGGYTASLESFYFSYTSQSSPDITAGWWRIQMVGKGGTGVRAGANFTTSSNYAIVR